MTVEIICIIPLNVDMQSKPASNAMLPFMLMPSYRTQVSSHILEITRHPSLLSCTRILDIVPTQRALAVCGVSSHAVTDLFSFHLRFSSHWTFGVSRSNGRDQVDEEGEDVEGEYEGDGPF